MGILAALPSKWREQSPWFQVSRWWGIFWLVARGYVATDISEGSGDSHDQTGDSHDQTGDSRLRARHYPWLRPFTHLGSSIENIRRDLIAQHALVHATRAPSSSAELHSLSAVVLGALPLSCWLCE
jgi:hypothetical protein